MMDWNGNMSAAGWIFLILIVLLFLGLLVGVIAWTAQGIKGRAADQEPSAPAEILNRRLATGELTVEEYRELQRALSDGASSLEAEREPLRRAGASP
jgi:uncharacterized membrane protein